jgi:hypothetical protein
MLLVLPRIAGSRRSPFLGLSSKWAERTTILAPFFLVHAFLTDIGVNIFTISIFCPAMTSGSARRERQTGVLQYARAKKRFIFVVLENVCPHTDFLLILVKIGPPSGQAGYSREDDHRPYFEKLKKIVFPRAVCTVLMF